VVNDEEPPRCPVVRAPVVPCEPAELAPLLAWLASDEPSGERRTFPRGTALADGRLDLCKQGLGPDGGRAVLAALAHDRRVRHLLLGTNGIGDAGARAAADLLAQRPGVETLYLGCNLIGPDGARALAQALTTDASVSGLWLKRNPVGDDGARALADMLRKNASLRALDLVHTGIGAEGLDALARALVDAGRVLDRLDLGGNRLEARAVAPIVDAARRGAIRRLSLAVNALGDEGARLVADALAAGAPLDALGLGSNGIGPDGVVALGEALGRAPSLTSLDLSRAPSTRALGGASNEAGDEGAVALARALEGPSALRRLDLAGCGVRGRGAKALLAALETNRTLVWLRLGAGAPRAVVRRLRVALTRNAALAPAAALAIPPELAAIQSVYR
jgi:Ran GTPase-activating protein (RanGAP) involved in mRNA processing and transport